MSAEVAAGMVIGIVIGYTTTVGSLRLSQWLMAMIDRGGESTAVGKEEER
jgi:hypothetical protein